MHPSADLNSSLEKALKDRHLEDLLFYSKILQHWNVIVQEPLSSRTAPYKLEKHTLHVHVEDAAYSYHLKHYEKQILDYIRAVIQSRQVQKIRFSVGPLNKTTAPSPQINDSKNPETQATPITKETENTSRLIQNERTRIRFSRWMNKRRQKQKNG